MMQRNRWFDGAILLLVVGWVGLGFAPAAASGGKPVTKNVHSFAVESADGGSHSLADYRGKTLLIVNTASRCGFTPQYKSLEALYRKYRERGLVVLAFPANNFMNQEPGTNEEIQTFCTTKYNTTFPVFAKVSVKGKDIAPLYAFLTRDAGHPGDIEWNFTKFLVAPDGRVVDRFGPATDPLDKDVVARVEQVLEAK
jgi:glutathione peroxidase